MHGRSMTEGTPWKHILRFALPILAGSLLQQLYNTVDTIIVGNFTGQDALSAVGTTTSFTLLFLALAIGISAGCSVVVAQYYGAGNEVQVRCGASTGILLLMGMGVLSVLVGIALSRPAFVHVIGVTAEILDQTLQYFRIYALGLVFQFGYNAFSSILRAVGDSAATLYFLLISSVINVVLDLLLVAVFRWGVVGAAVATVAAQAGSFVAAYFYMIKKYPVFRFRIREYTWDTELAKKTLSTGFPIAMQMIIVSLGSSFILRAVNGFGKDMTASFTVGHRIEMYINLPGTALQTTLATYVGQNIGAGRMDNVKRGVRHALVISLIITLLVSLAIWLFTDSIIALFGLGAQSMIYCRSHLRTIALINIVLSMYLPLFGVFQASRHGSACTVVATGALGIRVIMTYLLRYSAFLGHAIIWWNGIFGFGTGFLISWIYYLSGRWQKNAALTGNRKP